MLKIGDRVTLVERWGGLEPGSVGLVVAAYIRPSGDELAVEFGATSLVMPTHVLAPAVTDRSAEPHA